MAGRIARKMTYADSLQWLADNDDVSCGATVTCCFVADMFGKGQDDVAASALAIWKAQHPGPEALIVRELPIITAPTVD